MIDDLPRGQLREARAEERRRLEADRNRRGRNVPWRRKYRDLRRKIGGVLVRLFAPIALRTLAATWRIERCNHERMQHGMADTGLILAMWHGRMLPALPLHKKLGIIVLVSMSGDGGLVINVLRRFGCGIIRGSTSRRGARAMREMREHLSRGNTVVITPDGPRGPRHSMNIGLAWLARESHRPILSLGVACDRAWRLKSWDGFLIPKPFARIRVTYHEPIVVAPDADEEELERVTACVHDDLLADERASFEHLGVAPDW